MVRYVSVMPDMTLLCLQEINAVEEAKKNLAPLGRPVADGQRQGVLMHPARENTSEVQSVALDSLLTT